MPRNRTPNKYVVPTLPGIDPKVARVIQDLTDRVNFLTEHVPRVREEANDVTGLAKKENPVKGVITLFGTEQNGFIRVSSDGVIASYTNPVASQTFPYVDLRSVANVGAALSDLHTFNLPIGTLANDGDWLAIEYTGNFAATAANKQVAATFDGQGFIDTGLIDLPLSVGWVATSTITRLSSTSVVASSNISSNIVGLNSLNVPYTFGAGGEVVARGIVMTGIANLNSSLIPIVVQGRGGVGGDVFQVKSIIELKTPQTVVLL